MNNDVRKTIRIPSMFNEELTRIAKEKKLTFNGLIINILYHYMNKVGELSDSGAILKKLNDIHNDIDKQTKKNSWTNLIVKQIFLNSGFPRNRKISEDKTFNDFVESHKDKYE